PNKDKLRNQYYAFEKNQLYKNFFPIVNVTFYFSSIFYTLYTVFSMHCFLL
ncbi:hypothetical protein C2G38_2121840, partial [Gigaspora rosea]